MPECFAHFDMDLDLDHYSYHDAPTSKDLWCKLERGHSGLHQCEVNEYIWGYGKSKIGRNATITWEGKD